MFDYEANELIGKGIDYWSDKIHPEDTLKSKLRLIDHFKMNSESFECEMRLKNKSGNWVWTLCKGKVIKRDDLGKASLMTGYHQDISGRKKSEEELRRSKQLLDQTNEVAKIGTWDVDLTNEVVTWSQVTHQIHEVAAGFMPTVAEGLVFYKKGENRERITAKFTEAVTNGVGFDEELQIITAENNEKWVRTIGIPVFSETGISRVYGVFQDITDLKKAQREIELQLMLKNEKNDRLTNFSYIVSHNLRSHSVNLAMIVKLMKKRNPDFCENEVFRMLELSTGNLSETIGHLNEVATLQVTVADSLTSYPINTFITKAIADITPSVLECKGSITFNENNDLNAYIIPAYLDSAILNLLTNAVKYRADDWQAEIEVSSYIDNEFVVIEVADNGLGIDLDKHRHKLFGMYKVFHDKENAKGIGLFISKSQIEAMDGHIKVESEVNKGSKFKIYLKHDAV